jgi:hypothetical protein
MATLTVTLQNVWPPRHLLTVAGLTNEFFTLWRVSGGTRVAVRGAYEKYIWPATAFVVVDAEFPFGTPFTYELIDGAGNLEDTDGPHTVTLPGGNVAVTDALNGLAAEVQVGAVDDLARDGQGAVYNVDGFNRVVAPPIGQPQTVIEYFTATLTARNNLREVLANATQGIYQQRSPSPAYDGDAYYAVVGSRERRFSQDGTDERRITAVTVAEVTGWSQSIEARGYTYQDVADAYAPTGTYADVAGDYATYLELAQGDFS